MPVPDILPNSLARETRGVVMRDGVPWIPIFCANCGADGGFVPQTQNFVCYLCDNGCAEKFGDLPPGMFAIPQEAFWQKVNEAMLEKYGRVLSAEEIVVELDDPESVLSKLAREGRNG